MLWYYSLDIAIVQIKLEPKQFRNLGYEEEWVKLTITQECFFDDSGNPGTRKFKRWCQFSTVNVLDLL